ncbi:MAG: tail fiber domain-containing protein [bacterium]
MVMIKRFLRAFVVTAACLVSVAAWAVPGLINYQGKLTDPGNSALTGTYQMVFSLYAAQTGGTALWTEEQSVTVADGIFHVQLGTATSLPVNVFDHDELYLEIVIDSETLTPRQRITSTAFAMKAADGGPAVGDGHSLNAADGDPVDVVYVDDGGNVGIGTTSPTHKLHVDGDMKLSGGINMTTVDKEIRLSTGRIISQSVPNRLTVESFVAGQPLFLRGPGGIQFYAHLAESMRITDTGNVGIGTTSPSQKLDVAGNVIANAYSYHSDARLKKNVTPIDHALDKVTALQGVEFEWRTEEFPEKGFAEGRKIGLIAQGVEKVLPEVVSTDSEGYRTVEYANIVGVLVEGMKELKAQNDDLKAQNEGLRILLGQVLKRIEALENK